MGSMPVPLVLSKNNADILSQLQMLKSHNKENFVSAQAREIKGFTMPRFLDTTFAVPYLQKPKSWIPSGSIIVSAISIALFSSTKHKFVAMAWCKNNFATIGIPTLQFVNGARSV
jgi:hypothetical protein